jgi:YfiH family protein
MTIHKKNGITWYSSDLLEQAGVKHGFFMRHGGCSPQPWYSLNLATSVGDSRENVIENRDRIADALDVARGSYYDVWQVHSARVVQAKRPRLLEEEHLQADAIVTDQKGVSILMLFADCVPILFYDPVKKIVAGAHGGWQGTFKGVAGQTVQVMQENYGCNPGDILAVIGPSISVKNYEVGPEVAQAAQAHFDDETGVVQRKNGRTFVDLQLANQLFLERAGVRQITRSGICTMAENEDWFSHRGEHGLAGRFGAVITLGRDD